VAAFQAEDSANGFEILRLSNANMSVSVMPQLGGKIHELIDLRTARDWLWKNPYIALRHPQAGLDYDRELDSGGWDEILFSVKPCSLELADGKVLSIGDHGTVVDKAWQTGKTGLNEAGEAICELFVEGRSPDFRLHRRMVLDAVRPRLHFEYRLSNTGPGSWPWIWCAHPLLAIEPGMSIRLKKGQPIQLMPNNEPNLANAKKQLYWPNLCSPTGENLDLAGIFKQSAKPETFCAKLFVGSGEDACLSTADGSESLCLMYDPEILPWLGLWVNKNGWSGCNSRPYMNLGMEPATSPQDTLSEAVKQGQACFLQSGASKQWSLTISLDNMVNE